MTSTQDADIKPSLAALVDKHAERLNEALAAIAGRGYWSAYPESPSPRVYGETAAGFPLPVSSPTPPVTSYLAMAFRLCETGAVVTKPEQ